MRPVLLACAGMLLAGVPGSARAGDAFSPRPMLMQPLAGSGAAASSARSVHKARHHAVRGRALASRHAKPRRTLSGLLNLNQASAEQMGMFPGLGARKVKAVIAARPFAASWEVGKVRGVGPTFFKKYQDHLRVDGPTTLTWLTAVQPGHGSR